ncbi:MAG: sigma-70 family RNA polymerase sigma factor [Planctomycetota bacterium]
MGDAELVEHALRGDRSALEELVHRHIGTVRATALAVLGPHPDLDDVTQEAMLGAIERLHTLRARDRVGAWLRGITRNLCRDRLRHRGRALSLDESSAAAAAPVAENAATHESPLLAAVAELPEKLREALLLFYVENATYAEIAEQLNISAAAVNRRLTRARQLLRERLARKEGSDVE